MRAPSTRQGYTVMELSPSPAEATPNHVRSIDKSRAEDWIEGARMASPPLSPGFASRLLESHPSPPRVSSTVAARNLVPGKVISSESLLSLTPLSCCPTCCVCAVCCVRLAMISARKLKSLDFYRYHPPPFRSSDLHMW
ncbi:hypothetical protein VPH35_007786 [Triticum aestivum]